MKIQFEAGAHRYYAEEDDGRRWELPGVSRILRDTGLVDETWYTERARARGLAVHRACVLDDQGILDETTVDPEIRGELKAWREAKAILQPQIGGIEVVVWDLVLGFAGRADRLGFINGRDAVWDLKSGSKASWHRKQVAFYALGAGKLNAGIVYLGKAGSWKLDMMSRAELREEIDGLPAIMQRYREGAISVWT